MPLFGALTGTHLTALLQESLPEVVWVWQLDASSRTCRFAAGGVPDTPEMRAGVTYYLGVNVSGALLSLGDGHARQGEGETCGVAVECAMNTVLVVDLIKGVSCPWPRLESDTHIMSAGSARPLEDAFRIARHDMVAW